MSSIAHIAVWGSGLAGCLAALALRQALPKDTRISVVEVEGEQKSDVFYGTITSPTFYDFLLALGLSEPDVLQETQATFSLGTQYSNWGEHNRSWMQTYFVAAPSFENIGLHHVLARLGESHIAPFLLSSMMAEQGVFAHPPEQGETPLKNVEYGYHFLPERLCRLARQSLEVRGVEFIKAEVMSFEHNKGVIVSAKLSNGEVLKADLYVHAAAHDRVFQNSADWIAHSTNKLSASQNIIKTGKIDGVCRRVECNQMGWSEISPLQGESLRTDFQFSRSESAGKPSVIELGRLGAAWTGNCVSIGLAASALAPVTPAPMMMLKKDIERLLELFPIEKDMEVERAEYNRRFAADVDHAQMFTDMFFETETKASKQVDGDYAKRFSQKTEQFSERGILVQYDYEPFNGEDWLQLYLGLGLRPKRYDRLADGIPLSQLQAQLDQIKTINASLVKRIPPHGLYLKKLLEFLEKRHG